MPLREIIKLCKRIYCKLSHDRLFLIIILNKSQAEPLVYNTFISQIRNNAIGSGNVLRFQSHGIIPWKRNV